MSLKSLLEKIMNNPDASDIDESLNEVKRQIDALFDQIGSCNSVAEAAPLFTSLDRIQFVLATVTFKFKKDLPPDLRQFVRDYDRLDTEIVRTTLFKRLRKSSG